MFRGRVLIRLRCRGFSGAYEIWGCLLRRRANTSRPVALSGPAKPEEQVREIVLNALRHHDAFISPRIIAFHARRIARPWEPLLHPLGFRRWWKRLAETPDVEGDEMERQHDGPV